jgi:hypothetical protein
MARTDIQNIQIQAIEKLLLSGDLFTFGSLEAVARRDFAVDDSKTGLGPPDDLPSRRPGPHPVLPPGPASRDAGRLAGRRVLTSLPRGRPAAGRW